MNEATATNECGVKLSTVSSAIDTTTRDFTADGILEIVRSGGKNIRSQVEAIRETWRCELDSHGDYKQAKKAIDPAKKKLRGVLWSGTFTERSNDKLLKHSGLLCADLDNLGAQLKAVREMLLQSPYVWAVFLSPSGDGLKAVFRVPADGLKHRGSFRAVERHVKELTDVQIDEACKDVARICFLSYDPEVFHNPQAIEIEPLAEPAKPQTQNNGHVDLSARQRIAAEILGSIDWESETSGVAICPGKHSHTTGDGARDCMIDLDQVPTVHCFHNSCRALLDGVNHELRSRIGKTEYASNGPAHCTAKPPQENGASGTPAQEKFWPEPFSMKQFLSRPADATRYLWAKTLAARGGSMIVAQARDGKSYLSLNLGLAVSRGVPFLGRQTVKAPVLYLSLDNSLEDLDDFVEKLGVRPEDQIFIQPAPIPSNTDEWLVDVIKRKGVKLAIVDTLQRFFQLKDSNDYSEAVNRMTPLDNLAKQIGFQILYVHHSGKSGSFLGSTAFKAMCPTYFELTRVGELQQRILKSDQRTGKNFESVAIGLSQTGWLEITGTYEDAQINEVMPKIRELLEMHANNGVTEPNIRREMPARGIITSKAIRAMYKAGTIERMGQGKKGDPFKYCLAGSLLHGVLHGDSSEGPSYSYSLKKTENSGLAGLESKKTAQPIINSKENSSPVDSGLAGTSRDKNFFSGGSGLESEGAKKRLEIDDENGWAKAR